jgi:hypothetical protein
MTPPPPFKAIEGDCELCTQAVLMLKANCICPNFWSIPAYLVWISDFFLKRRLSSDFLHFTKVAEDCEF